MVTFEIFYENLPKEFTGATSEVGCNCWTFSMTECKASSKKASPFLDKSLLTNSISIQEFWETKNNPKAFVKGKRAHFTNRRFEFS